MEPPHFIDSGIQFTAIIPRHGLVDKSDLDWVAQLPENGRLTDSQRLALIEMRHGREWNNPDYRQRFGLDSAEVRRELTELVELGLCRPTGGRRYRSHVTESANAEGDKSVVGTKNGAEVLAAVAQGAKSLADIVSVTALTAGQVQYALRALVQKGLVVLTGGRGRGARYTLATGIPLTR